MGLEIGQRYYGGGGEQMGGIGGLNGKTLFLILYYWHKRVNPNLSVKHPFIIGILRDERFMRPTI